MLGNSASELMHQTLDLIVSELGDLSELPSLSERRCCSRAERKGIGGEVWGGACQCCTIVDAGNTVVVMLRDCIQDRSRPLQIAIENS